MTCSTSLSGKNRIVLIAGILMIATTLRVTFTGAAPLLDTIRSTYSLTTAQTGLSGSSCTLLCSRPLRTVRASFPAYGSSLSITPH